MCFIDILDVSIYCGNAIPHLLVEIKNVALWYLADIALLVVVYSDTPQLVATLTIYGVLA